MSRVNKTYVAREKKIKCKNEDCDIYITKANKSGFCCYHYTLDWKRKQRAKLK